MYYSKNTATRREGRIVVPENYSGNTFRVKDESPRRSPQSDEAQKKEEFSSHELPDTPSPTPEEDMPEHDGPSAEAMTHIADDEKKKERAPSLLSSLLPPRSSGSGLLSSFLHDIDIEDIIILGLLLVLWRDDTDDDILLLLIILLFLK